MTNPPQRDPGDGLEDWLSSATGEANTQPAVDFRELEAMVGRQRLSQTSGSFKLVKIAKLQKSSLRTFGVCALLFALLNVIISAKLHEFLAVLCGSLLFMAVIYSLFLNWRLQGELGMWIFERRAISRATALLQGAGYKVGLFGANIAEVEAGEKAKLWYPPEPRDGRQEN